MFIKHFFEFTDTVFEYKGCLTAVSSESYLTISLIFSRYAESSCILPVLV